MKRIIITTVFILCTLFVIIFFKKFNYKIKKNGNNIINKASIEDILNMSSYKAKIEVTVNSNKNTNKYIINQEYTKDNNYSMQEIIEPQNISGVKFTYNNHTLTIENTKLNLKTIYEDYSYIETNNLFLNSFIEDYKKDDNSKIYEEDEFTILETKPKEERKYNSKKKLYLSNETGNPIKLEVQDSTQNVLVYILYNEIEIN